MGNLTLRWTAAGGSNSTNQLAKKRIKGQSSYDTSGFTPANPLSATANTAVASVTDNTVYEFSVTNNCAVGGPVDILQSREGIVFACITPTISKTWNTVTVTTSNIPASITRVAFSIYDGSGTLIKTNAVNTASNSATTTFDSLAGSTLYVIKQEFTANVNNVDQTSDGLCGDGFQVTTYATPICDAPSNLTVTIS